MKHPLRQITAVLAILVTATTVSAGAVGELASAIDAASRSSKQLAADKWNFSAERKLIERIDGLAERFHSLASEGASMPKTASKLLALLDGVRKRYTEVLESMQAEVIRIDGDLEAVQDSAAWQQRELLAMRLLYQLNWARYETAMRYETDAAKRKKLLELARRGFSEFLGSKDHELTVESLLGHGLASKVLRDYPTAIDDFRTALDNGPNAQTQHAIRTALAEAFLASGQTEAALAETKRLVSDSIEGKPRSQALFLRAKTLLLLLHHLPRKSGASNKSALRKEAARILEQLFRRGSYWKSKVTQLVDAGIDHPSDWARAGGSLFVSSLAADSLRRRGHCKEATELYKRLLGQAQYQSNASYGIGFCRFHDSAYEAAIKAFSDYLTTASSGDGNRGEAAYLRFKAAESLYLRADRDTRPAAESSYIQLLNAYLKIAPNHSRAFEAWFRLGEWHREHEEFADCALAFTKVRGSEAFTIKAGFLAAQCRVEAVLAVPDSQDPPPDLVRTAVAAIDGFLKEAGRYRKMHASKQALLDSLEAKAVVMAAATVTRSGVGSMKDRISRLRKFEERFPHQTALFAEVISLRIVAYRSLGRLEEAGVELEHLLAMKNIGSYRYDALRKLGIVFLRDAAKHKKQGDSSAAARSRHVALRIYERLLEDVKSGRIPVDSDARSGLESLVADLRQPSNGEARTR